MPQHKVHFYVESGWPDDYFAGCHIEEYHASTANEDKVTCKHCLRNLANERAQAQQKGPA